MASTTAVSSKSNSQGVLSPSKLAHVVLRTNNFEKMTKYWRLFLGARIIHQNSSISFLSYDEEHHRIAILSVPNLKQNDGRTTGLEHLAFTFDSIQDLCTAYKQCKELGITPGWCVNHGPTTSMYYRDPDGNTIEAQVDNFDEIELADEWMQGKEFAENWVGVDFDPEELCRRVEAGEDEVEIKKRANVGPRGTEAKPLIEAMMKTSQVGV